ncbi:PIKFYVE, partial [Cordylochernes scorpioides]
MRMVGIHNSPVQGRICAVKKENGVSGEGVPQEHRPQDRDVQAGRAGSGEECLQTGSRPPPQDGHHSDLQRGAECPCSLLLSTAAVECCGVSQVKKIVQFLLYTAYNWRLEKSFLMDEYAMPPLGSEDMVADEFQSSSVTSREVVTNVVRPAELEISHSTSHLELVRDEAAKTIEKKYVEDFSDPLRSYLQMEEDLGAAAVTSPASSHSLLRVASMPLTSQFRKGLDGTILCCSPFITVALPYLETEPGKCCKLRPFFPEEIYWSRQFQKEAAVRKSLIMEESSENQEAPVLGYEECPPHPFVHKMLSEPLAKSTKIQCMLAEFRACGEKYRRVWHTVPNSNCDGSRHKALESTNYNDCPLDKYAGHRKPFSHIKYTMLVHKVRRQNPNMNAMFQLDVLSPYNHQKLSVLFCNHSYASNNAPNFCVDPRYTPIVLREVDLPPTIVTINETPVTIDEIVENIKCLSKKIVHISQRIKQEVDVQRPVRPCGTSAMMWCGSRCTSLRPSTTGTT